MSGGPHRAGLILSKKVLHLQMIVIPDISRIHGMYRNFTIMHEYLIREPMSEVNIANILKNFVGWFG